MQCHGAYPISFFDLSHNNRFIADMLILIRVGFFPCFQVDSEEERLPDEKYVDELAKTLPQGTDKTPEVLEGALKGLPDK